MLLDEFIPMIERRIPTQRRALLGWSMGGYGASARRRDVARPVPSGGRRQPRSGPRPARPWTARSTTPMTTRWHDVFRHAARLSALAVRIDCGKGDPFYPAARKFAGDLHPEPETSFGDGFHDAAYWRSVAPAQLRTITQAFNQ